MQKAYNPATGEVLFLVGDQWVKPSQVAQNPQTGEYAYLVNNNWELFKPPAAPAPAAQQPVADETERLLRRFPAPKESVFRQVADVPLGVAKGFTQGVRMMANVFGAGSDTSNTIKSAEDYLSGLMSAQAKNDRQAIARIMKDAEDKGVADQVLAGVKAFSVAPVDTLSSAFGTAGPIILSALGAKLLGAGALASTGISALMGAGMGAGTIKGTIYEETKRALIEAGADPAEAEKRAELAQRYDGKNLDQILLGTVIGGVAGVGPLEKGAASALARRILGATTAKEVAETAAAPVAQSAIRQRAVAGVKEAVPEFGQAFQEQTAGNVAQQREGFNVPTFRGAVGAGTLEGLAGLSLGALTGGAPPAEPAPAPERIEPTFEAPAPAPAPATAPAPGRIEPTFEAPAPVAPPSQPRITPGASAPLSPEEIEAKVADYSRFMPEEDARRVVLEEQQKAAEAAEAEATAAVTAPPAPAPAPELDPVLQRLKDLTQERIDAGVPPQQAALQALEQLQQEQQADEDAAKAAAEGEQRVAEPVTPPSGEGIGVAGVPSEQPPAGGVAGTERTGVVPTEADVGQPPAREGEQPSAVTPKVEETLEEADARFAAEDAAYQKQVDEDKSTGQFHAQTAFDQRGAYKDLDDAIDSYRENLADTLTEQGITDPNRFNVTLDAFNAEVAKLKAAEAPAAAPAPASVVEAPKGKRGRKPLPPEQQAKSEERRKEQRREANAAAREVERLKAELAKAKETVEPGNYPNETEYSEAKISQGMRRKRALAALYDFSRTNRNKPGQEAKAVLEAEASKQEIDDIAKGHAVRKQAAKKVSPQQKDESRTAEAVNPKLKGVTTGLQAIGVLLRTGTIFQKLMAMRIRNSVRNVKVVILEKDDPTPSALLTDAVLPYWESARALYVHDDATGADTVYIRGESFGADQGLNNVTVLHELLHAATAQKLQLALRLMKRGLDSGAPVVKAAKDIQETMRAVADDFVRQNKAGTIPRHVAMLFANTGGAIITDVKEFVAYGLSDPIFQRYLNSITDVVEPSETFFSRFVDGIRALFGIPEDMHTAMTNLVNATDKLISSPKTERMRLLEEKDKKLAKVLGEKQRVSPQTKDKRTLDEIDKEVDEALLKFQQSKTAEEAAEKVGLLHSLRRWEDLKRYFNSLYNTLDAKRLGTVLSIVPTDVVSDWGSGKVPSLKDTNDLLVDMRNMQYQLVTSAAEVSENMVRAIKKDPSLYDKLAEVMSVATDVRVDPAVDNRNKKLSDLYNDLGTEGQRIYKEVRDYYTRMVELYSSLLDAQIQEANLPPDAKKAIMAEIRRKFELDKKIVPYFPFVRNRGTHWLRVKPDPKSPSQFYMLGSIAERDAVAAAIAEKQGKTVKELFDGGVFKAGDSIETLRKMDDTVGFSEKVKDIFSQIDKMSSLGPKDKEAVKNSVYELYLATVPEQSFRKGFIERKDVAGYSTDVVRAFSSSSLRFASQLPRIKYGQKLRMSLFAGRKSLEGNPDQAKLERFVGEMETRVDQELNPDIRKGTWESTVDFVTRLAFIHYLSAAGSAILQGVGILYGASTIGARHGYGATALEMGKMMRIFGEYSIIKKNTDGTTSIKPPSVATSKRVATNPMERRAIREVFGSITEHTLSSEVLGRGRVSTAKFEGRGSMVGRGLSTVVGGLFHTTERLVRETLFMTSFRLSMKEGQKKGLKGDELFDYAKRQAVADVYDSVGNMREENRPPMFRNATGRFLLQFLHYPMFITIRWMQEFKRMLPFMGNEAKFQAFKEFAGIMGTTYLLGGVVALPFVKEMAGFIAAAFDDWDEEDKPADMRNMSYWTWWANVWLPEYLGQVGIFGKSLNDLTGMSEQELAAVITRGPVNALTGRDISSRVSISPTDMLLGGPDKETRTTREGAIALALERAGPAANMMLSYMDAYDAWQNGDMQKTMEKMLPAVARNVVIAEKYRKEGVKDYKGNILIGEDSFTKGDYLYQSIGLRPDDLANHQKVLFEMSRGENKIRFERERIIRNTRDATLKGDTKRLEKMAQEQSKFNVRYPEYEITKENIDRSLDMSIEELLDSFKGFRPTDKNMRIFAPTAIESGRALAESREKKKE